MPAGSSPKRERQYEHIKASAKRRGVSNGRAEEIAARTVNKGRARHGESKTGQRGGNRSHTGPKGRTKEQLYNEAKRKNIAGRSKMSKAELEKAVGG